VLHAGGLPRLTHLELCGNRLTTLAPLVDAATATTDGTTAPDGANGTGNANEADGPRRLEVLKCDHNALDDASVVATVRAAHAGRLPCLHTLWLGANKLGDPSLEALSSWVSEEATKLRSLNLALNYFSHNGKQKLQAGARAEVRITW